MSRLVLTAAAVLGLAGTAGAGISVYDGQDPHFSAIGTADFNSGELGGGGTWFPNIDDGGMNFRGVHSDPNNQGVFWGYAFPGGDGTASCYFNGGANDVMGIQRTDGHGFDTMELQVGAGFGGPTVYLWIQALSGGVQVASFDLDKNYGDYIGITGGGFDEVRIGGYNDADTRNAHSEQGYQALAVDNVSYGGPVPAPGAAAILGLGALAAGRRRR
jgi:MYXO-CTERM domain-containing protein